MEPILKWAGGKRQILPEIISLINIDENATFYEPFVGGGIVFMSLSHPHTVINDCNRDLINVYEQIKIDPEKLISLLKVHKANHSNKYYYDIRDLQYSEAFDNMSATEKAARTIYLNRTCYNGLYRVNANGFFNVPVGGYKRPHIVQEQKIKDLSEYLNQNDIQILCGDFSTAVEGAKPGDVVYFDPPYDYESEGFTKYTAERFSRDDLGHLKELCDSLIAKGCHVIVSNNDTTFVRNLFSDNHYIKKVVSAKRYINCNGDKRSAVKELIITG